MANTLKLIQQTFKTKDLYEILEIETDDAEDSSKLRKAYLKAALKYHPDKAEGSDKDESTKKFQMIGKIFEFLKDDDKRKNYNETGTWGEDMELEGNLFAGARLDDSMIALFKESYQGSDEEKGDIKKFYEKFEGDILKILDHVYFVSILDDEARIQRIIDEMIEKGEVTKYEKKKGFEAARKRKIAKAKKEAKEAEEAKILLKKKYGKVAGDGCSLEQAIIANAAQRNKSFLENLEAKYSTAKPAKKKARKN